MSQRRGLDTPGRRTVGPAHLSDWQAETCALQSFAGKAGTEQLKLGASFRIHRAKRFSTSLSAGM